ncbi:MAG TPA: putative O-glycosylation ligase, exosortase A system-associated [Noviherbaspirillum sp.]|nr:putative O-glycosylation ligase, exosortase A system-associated [Noviherbaspirillum sp.]
MRDYLLFAVVFGILPWILKRPSIGILMATWISLMNPHRLAYGPAYDFPFAAVVVAATLAGLLFSHEPKRIPFTKVTVLLFCFMGWMTLTSFFALEPDLVWGEWNRVLKTFFMVILASAVLHTEKEIKALAWITGLSLGFYGFKGGVFTLLSGGSSHVFGPTGSYITDNNALALALVTALPLIWYLRQLATNKWLRHALLGLLLLTGVSIVGSYSRGALLGGSAMLFALWLKSRNKLGTGIVLAIAAAFAFSFMPEKWFDRMGTIGTYTEDASALGRINAWHFSVNVANNHLLGGGYNVFSKNQFLIYAPDPLDFHAAHSIYFQVLGEHGFIGLGIFVMLIIFAWRTGSRVIKHSKDKAELKWAYSLATMCQVSIVGYAIGGAFLSLAYYDLFYGIIVLLVLLEKCLLLSSPHQQKISPFQKIGAIDVLGRSA